MGGSFSGWSEWAEFGALSASEVAGTELALSGFLSWSSSPLHLQGLYTAPSSVTLCAKAFTSLFTRSQKSFETHESRFRRRRKKEIMSERLLRSHSKKSAGSEFSDSSEEFEGLAFLFLLFGASSSDGPG